MATREQHGNKANIDYLTTHKVDPYHLIIQKFNEGTKAVFLGEMHSSSISKSQQFCADLIPKLKKAGVRYLALEIPTYMQESVDVYSVGDKTEGFFDMYVGIINAAKTSGMDIICFDPRIPIDAWLSGAQEPPGADRRMALNVALKLPDNPDAKVLVYAGAAHGERTASKGSMVFTLDKFTTYAGKVYSMKFIAKDAPSSIKDLGKLWAVFKDEALSKGAFAIDGINNAPFANYKLLNLRDDKSTVGSAFDGLIFIP